MSARHMQRKQEQRRQKTFANPPSTVNLPGGVKLLAYSFRITRVEAGKPVAFERAEPGTPSDFTLWGAPEFMDAPLPDELRDRLRERTERLARMVGSPVPTLRDHYEQDRVYETPKNQEGPFVEDSRDIIGTTGYKNPDQGER